MRCVERVQVKYAKGGTTRDSTKSTVGIAKFMSILLSQGYHAAREWTNTCFSQSGSRVNGRPSMGLPTPLVGITKTAMLTSDNKLATSRVKLERVQREVSHDTPPLAPVQVSTLVLIAFDSSGVVDATNELCLAVRNFAHGPHSDVQCATVILRVVLSWLTFGIFGVEPEESCDTTRQASMATTFELATLPASCRALVSVIPMCYTTLVKENPVNPNVQDVYTCMHGLVVDVLSLDCINLVRNAWDWLLALFPFGWCSDTTTRLFGVDACAPGYLKRRPHGVPFSGTTLLQCGHVYYSPLTIQDVAMQHRDLPLPIMEMCIECLAHKWNENAGTDAASCNDEHDVSATQLELISPSMFDMAIVVGMARFRHLLRTTKMMTLGDAIELMLHDATQFFRVKLIDTTRFYITAIRITTAQIPEHWIACHFTRHAVGLTTTCFDSQCEETRKLTASFSKLERVECDSTAIELVDERYVHMELLARLLSAAVTPSMVPSITIDVDVPCCPFPNKHGVLAIDIMNHLALTKKKCADEFFVRDRVQIKRVYDEYQYNILSQLQSPDS